MKSLYLFVTKIIYLSAPKIVETASRFNGNNPRPSMISIALTIIFATIEKRLNDRKKYKGDDTDHAEHEKKGNKGERRKNNT